MADEHQRSAHRPSRRSAIVNAAIRVFARQGFADASIQTVAAEAGVAPTAVYYHFAGKDELFEAALRQVLTSMSEVVVAARADDEPGNPEILGHVIAAVWGGSRPTRRPVPSSTTTCLARPPGLRALQHEFESVHVARAFAYISPPIPPRSRRSAAARHASETLAARTFIGLATLVHPMRAGEGPLNVHSDRTLLAGLIDVSTRILDVADDRQVA